MSNWIGTCEVDGCENDAHTTCEAKDDNGEVIGKKSFCKEHIKLFICQKHFRQAVNNILEKHSLGRHNNDV